MARFTISFLQFIFNVHVQCRRFWQFTFHGVHCNHDSQNSFSEHYDSRTPKMVNHSFTKISLPPCHHLSFFTESTVYLFTSCLWSPGFVWPDTCAKYWITFLVFSVFPAPDSPLKPKWKHCLRLFWGTNRGMTLIKRLKLTSGMKYQLKLFCLFSSLLGSCWSKIHWLVKPDYP